MEKFEQVWNSMNKYEQVVKKSLSIGAALSSQRPERSICNEGLEETVSIRAACQNPALSSPSPARSNFNWN